MSERDIRNQKTADEPRISLIGAIISGVKNYMWRTGTIYEGDQYQCRIRVMVAGDVIGGYEGSRDIGTCSVCQ